MNRGSAFPHPFFSMRPTWKWFILSTVLVGATMSALDVSIVNVAMPTLKSDFNVSMATIEWVAMAYMLTLTIFLPLFGRLADMFGRSRLYTAGFVVFTAGSALCGMAPTASLLIGARIFQAVGAGLLQANSVALITQAFPSTERGKAIGIQGAIQAVAMSVGPFIGGIMIAALGWRAIFFVNIPIGIIGIIAAFFILPPHQKKGKKEKIDYLGAFSFAAGLAFLVMAFNEGVKLGWESTTIIVYFAHAAILLALFVVTELNVKHPLIDLKLFSNRTFALSNLTGMMSYYVLFAVLFLMPFYLERVLNVGVAMTGMLLTPIFLAMAVIAPLSGHISDRYGSRIMTSAGMLVSALACGGLLFAGVSTHVSILATELILLGVGMGMFIPSNNSAIMGAAPREKLGVASGILNMTRSLGLIFGVDISGVIFTSLEHKYLTDRGYQNVHHVFHTAAIPLADKDAAFLHGFLEVILVLVMLNLGAALLSAAKSETLEVKAARAAKQFEGI
jgi:EmrB/QacA subfamily drug resistance transporter